MNQDHVNEYCDKGLVVIPSVLNEQEILEARRGLHESLMSYGCDVNALYDTAGTLESLSSTGGSGGVLDLFYEEWKLKLNEHPKIVSAVQTLWANTYACCTLENGLTSVFSHPYGAFDPFKGYMYIDRVCFRVPSAVSDRFKVASKMKRKGLQRSLTPHLDCCPHDMFGSNCKKWRPIQAFVSLTDSLEPEQGGFEACPYFHKEFYSWSSKREEEAKQVDLSTGIPPCVGDFTPISMSLDRDKEVLARFKHIPVRAGDLVLWDNKLPHANSRFNKLATPREVVYIGLLPEVSINRLYAKTQLERFRQGEVPTDQWHSCGRKEVCSYSFSDLGRKLMSIDSW
jgi:hypothetical protein